MATPTRPKVKPLMQQWQFTQGLNETTSRKVYMDSASVPSGTEEDLPDIGSSWSSDYSTLTCKRITISYAADRPSCPQIYTLDYDTTPASFLEMIGSEQNVPVQASVGATFDTFDNPAEDSAGQAYWSSDSVYATGMRLPKLVMTESITITRYIFGKDLKEWHESALWVCLGKVNKAAMSEVQGGSYPGYAGSSTAPTGFTAGTVLFLGAEMEEQISHTSQRKWLVRMQFQVRLVGDGIPTDATAKGWNYVYRNDIGDYDKLLVGPDGSGKPLYAEADFSLLFSKCLPSSSTSLPGLPLS